MYAVSVGDGVVGFIKSLEKPTIAKVLRTIDLLELYGYRLTLPHCKKIIDNLWELRIRGNQEVRIFYTQQNGTYFLLHGFIKSTQKTPPREIQRAIHELQKIDAR
jgi:phage-related protein